MKLEAQATKKTACHAKGKGRRKVNLFTLSDDENIKAKQFASVHGIIQFRFTPLVEVTRVEVFCKDCKQSMDITDYK